MKKIDFKTQYYKCLEDNFQNIKIFEIYRKKLIIKTFFISLIFFAGALVSVFSLSFMILKNYFNPVLFAFLLFALYVCCLKSITTLIITDRQYQQKFYNKIFPFLLQPVANFKNWPKNQNTDAIIDSLLFPNFDTQEDNSCIFGYYKSSSITIADTRLTLPVKASEKPDLFKGCILRIDIDKNIKNHIILISKNEDKYNRYHLYETKVAELNEYLSVSAKTDRYIDEVITEDFWEILQGFARAYCAKGFCFSYKDNTVIIAMRQRKAMPFGYIFKSVVKLKNYDEFIEKFIVIYELIDYINKD